MSRRLCSPPTARRWMLNAPRLLVLAWLVFANARAAASTFDDANRLYEQGRYREAVEAYHALVAAGTNSAALWFNLGNAQYKGGRVGDAIAAYRQAERLSPRDPDVRANLDFARRQVTGPTLKSGGLRGATKALTTNEWTLLAMVPVWAWFGLLVAGQLQRAWRPRLRRWAWSSGLAALLAVTALVVVLRHRFEEQTLVVNSRGAVVRAGPFEESPSAFTAADGAEFVLRDAKGDWYQVSDGTKPLGWLKTNMVMLLR